MHLKPRPGLLILGYFPGRTPCEVCDDFKLSPCERWLIAHARAHLYIIVEILPEGRTTGVSPEVECRQIKTRTLCESS